MTPEQNEAFRLPIGLGSGIIAFIMPGRPDKLSVETSSVRRQRQVNDAREKGE
jgi:hypothetical protein